LKEKFAQVDSSSIVRDGHMLRQGVALATLDFSIFFNIYTKATKEGEEEEGSYKLL
jgi:hypothetical protein